MRRVSVSSRPDCLVLHVGRDWVRLGAWGAVLLGGLSAIALVSPLDWVWCLSGLLAGLAVLPVAGVLVARAARATERTLVRARGRLLLDGEPLDLARVELRVINVPFLSWPMGYGLSLWVMTAVGPEDVPLGYSRTLFEASSLSGQIEEFVQRANIKAPPRLSFGR